MKTKFFIVALLIASLFLSAFIIEPTIVWPDPTVAAISGDTDFVASVTDPLKLSGTYKNDVGTPVPTGFPAGEIQFGGNGLVLKDVTSGSQSLCFSFPTYRYGWRGSIYQWNGSKWVKLATTITERNEGAPALACTTVYGNGTYALLIGFYPDLAPISDKKPVFY